MAKTAIYEGLLGLIFVTLSNHNLLLRRRLRVAIGDANDVVLIRATRAHANFSEYVPIALIRICFLESIRYAQLSIHLLCGALVTGRVVHAYGVDQVSENHKLRVVGMALALAVISSTSVRLRSAYM
ncbi:MAG: MAPEG family protein [Gammaproteobacteria bacterium]|nr:MAPEG family protein [Gammaproteobacteria bacterium]MDH3466738.1 MAPEG family protein [Gammaproteobacteria bacterium]